MILLDKGGYNFDKSSFVTFPRRSRLHSVKIFPNISYIAFIIFIFFRNYSKQPKMKLPWDYPTDLVKSISTDSECWKIMLITMNPSLSCPIY
jgi:hypothetical protein